MASSLVHHKRRIEDRISGLPDAILCHILSLCTTREAVQTSVLSHRWKNVWSSVPILDLDEQKYHMDYVNRTLPSPLRYVASSFAQFVNGLLSLRSPINIHRFHLKTTMTSDASLIYDWISTAVKQNVVELDLCVETPTEPHFEIPRSLFLCNTLVSLKLLLSQDVSAVTPGATCFPCLKFLHVTVWCPDSGSMEKLFSCCPALEHLILDGQLDDVSAYNINISGPKLKRLQISFIVHKFDTRSSNVVSYDCRIFVSADAPNLEELDIYYDLLVSYSVKDAKYLRKAKIDFLDVDELHNLHCFLGLAGRVRRLVAGIVNVKYLSVSAAILGVLDIRDHHLLSTLNDLKHLELQVQTCYCLQSLPTLLNLSPNLEHLEFENNTKFCADDNEDEFVHGWDAPELVPVCLFSHLKTICLRELKGCPKEMEMAKYLVKHGKALNKVTICTRFCDEKEKKLLPPIATLCLEVSKFPRGSRTCEIDFQTFT
uniref:F-box/LRR-repeat protein At3g59190-like isoform X1 n=1 Tax=Fragaria vesca subsp. vesca TaxID=101020 RepID=UPI0005C8747E|nr:PREDICTED: F-box/LRR-repeat protein At3g59190-like isoform X1 [Fragaria vesca subsp. vesca]XP_011463857.1 PREDICTED: F-box/LRR-repeat protein At3g59190-like isoform X1 [Fragaria vesca subsp. vesca]XP_011463858.1 PREDICTED: F-box/LRR-repeat protein At3g59190-like isoform X1 [Fragaria vesca subsp. vesca]XP_011463859.1 PREDICTED: F-box/LRR-repeat protein At3g59190-like isoform X1 [Fragaria vesca subsp. vesca]XP_011463860.1 PREDICTED: F-box/LRR-repeat protein At3g59190-like isoform X1 [Fragaria 